MFGEKTIVGRETVVTNNNQMKLPNFTNAEENDHIILSKRGKSIMLVNSNEYFGLIRNYEKMLGKAKSASDYGQLKRLIQSLYKNILDTTHCDKDLNITLPLDLNWDKVFCKGENKHLILSKSRKK